MSDIRRSVPRHDDSDQRLAFKEAAVVTADAGEAGVDIISDTTSHPGDWQWVQVLGTANAVINVCTLEGNSAGNLNGKTLLAGVKYSLPIIVFQLTSGSVALGRRTPV